MAVARKCDRCGQLYELPKVGELCGFAWLMGYDEDGETQFGKQYDLCADCTSKLSDFMEGNDAQHGEDCSGLEEVGSEEAEETVCEAGDSEGGEAEPADLPDVPEEKPEKLSYSVEEQVRMRLSGMLPKAIAEKCGVKNATISSNISIFKKENPDRYAELVAEYEKPAVEVTEGNA